ncbi:hypothetical protein HDU87_005069 [Geranomyces variabilis]|uniref:Histone acetyltransferase n=1 Tax=Geranomyces variabilis TaxID=109894 RepID=A0AAD5XQS8_9FUNG|nr:hypothetical protein HDU87_005069 [Geranomyces variabilis]
MTTAAASTPTTTSSRTSAANAQGTPEIIITCSTCNIGDHPSCLKLTEKAQDTVAHYSWQCEDCKVCMVCGKSDDEAQTVICDDCDRACHTFCASPRLSDVPEGTPRVKLVLSNKKTKSARKPDPPEQAMLPFGGRLTEADAKISACKPTVSDRAKFKKARIQAESLAAESSPALSSEAAENGTPVNGRRGYHEDRTSRGNAGDDVYYAPAEPKINSIYFGTREINTWYSAPYPEEYNGQSHIYICEYCFKYMKSQYLAGRHKAKCPLRHPPGDEIYRDGGISVFEVDGRKNKIYCQNLCLLAKMFLDHKTLYYDVEPFLFYLLTENDSEGCHFVGYFSKEKRSSANYNLSCIVTLPVSQRKGYGGLLIEFSYLLSQKEGRTGSPEKPLSDLGLVSYRRYWRRTVLRALSEVEGEEVSIDELSSKTCMTPDDVVHTLHLLSLLTKNARGEYVIRCPRALVLAYLAAVDAKKGGMATIKPDLLRWTPLLFKTPITTTTMPVVVEDGADEDPDGDGDGDADVPLPVNTNPPQGEEGTKEGQDNGEGATVLNGETDDEEDAVGSSDEEA